MSWFAAHIIMVVKLKTKRQRRFPVWENIVLVQADSEAQAFEKAERRGRLDEGDDSGSFRWGGQPASWVFAGVRKLTACEDPENRPADGTEVSYLELELDSEEAIAQFVRNKPQPIRLLEKFHVETQAHREDNREYRRRNPA